VEDYSPLWAPGRRVYPRGDLRRPPAGLGRIRRSVGGISKAVFEARHTRPAEEANRRRSSGGTRRNPINLRLSRVFGFTNLVGLTYNYCADFSDVDAAHTCASNNGNVTRQQIGFDAIAPAAAFSEAQVYQYNDVANRLTKASTASWTQPNLFDSVGNRWVDLANLIGLPVPTGETPTASSWFTAQNRINGWGYDDMGNVEAVGSMSRMFIYDAENRQVRATINGSVISYTYDGDGRRVTKTAPGLDAQGNPTTFTTTFVYDTDGQLAQEYSQAPATDSGTSYLTADHLGSTRLVTDGSGGVKKRFDYLPFGEELTAGTGGRTTDMRYNSSSTATQPDIEPFKFTSKERDAETGLDWFGTRYMSSAQGRFTSPDKPFADQYLHDPQSWNLYAYARNNPLRYIDDDGEGAKEFLYGLLNATSTNAVGGIGRAKSSDSDVRLGQKVGDTLSLIGGAIETAYGGTIVGGGGAACATGVGCLAGAPAIAGGLALGAHGILTATTAANNLLSNSLDDAPSSSGSDRPTYEASPKHGPTDQGDVSRGPKDGQTALDNSVQVKNTAPRRVGVDAANGEIVVLDQTSAGKFHGHVRSWNDLTDQQRNTLIKNGLADKRGNIIPQNQ
jgi:RHS repeat-associated protein